MLGVPSLMVGSRLDWPRSIKGILIKSRKEADVWEHRRWNSPEAECVPTCFCKKEVGGRECI